jgi:exosortase E/protease (VPEID-CTERM system)
LLLGGPGFKRSLRRSLAEPRRPVGPVLALATHVGAFAAFFALCGVVLGGDVAALPHATAWVAAWLGAGAAAAVAWALALAPPRGLARPFRESPRLLGVGLTIGLATAWAADRGAQAFWGSLQGGTFRMAAGLLCLAHSEVFADPASAILGASGFSVHVAPVCSGVEGMATVVVFLAVYLAWARRDVRLPHALLLFPLGVSAIWLLNAIRLAALVSLGAWGYPDLAVGGFHSQAGWVAFNLVGFGLVVAARRVAFFRPGARPDDAGVNPAMPYLVPILAVLAAAMLGGLFRGQGPDALYPLRVVAVVAALWAFRQQYAQMDWRPSWAAVGIGVVVFAAWMGLDAVWPRPAPAVGSLAAPGLAWAAVRVFGSVVTVPIAEELAFRGFLSRRLIAADFWDVPAGRFTRSSWLVSSLLFGLLHGRWLGGTVAGLLYALAYGRRGRIGDAVVAHAVTNALIAVVVLKTGDWSLWG